MRCMQLVKNRYLLNEQGFLWRKGELQFTYAKYSESQPGMAIKKKI